MSLQIYYKVITKYNTEYHFKIYYNVITKYITMVIAKYITISLINILQCHYKYMTMSLQIYYNVILLSSCTY